MNTFPIHAGLLSIVLISSFVPTVQQTIATEETPTISQSANKEDFDKALDFVLASEGGCADHPNDLGGRTMKGITHRTAKAHGWTGDVCSMPDSKIKEIYYQSYWKKPGCDKYAWPLNTVCFDTAVGSGSFVFSENLPDDPIKASETVIERRRAWRHEFVRRRPEQRVFLQGWLNRDAKLEKLVRGEK